MGEKKKQAHQALYRKYRPKSLDEVVGQEHITKTLANALKQGKISHAYLFTGPRGTGKTSIARILAHEINDIPYADDATNLDIIEIDAASNRRIDDIRDLRDKVHIAPIAAKYKVYIIDEVHMLTNESFNALLKTLEEPPEHVVFMLATTEVHKLPATIISRTQRHSLRLISPEKVAVHLKYIAKSEGLKIEDQALELLAEHGGGSFRDSISLLDQMSSSTDPISTDLVELLLGLAPKAELEKLLLATKSGDSSLILTHIEQLTESGLTPSGIAGQLLTLLRNEAKQGENSQQTTALMAELLTIHNAHYPQLKLETTLLSVSPKKTEFINMPAPEPVVEIKESTTKPKAVEKSELAKREEILAKPEAEQQPDIMKSENEETKEPAASANAQVTPESLATNWPRVLEFIKQKNNPLYTVLRLATPELDDQGLLLIFNFPFHQKKIEESKHKALVAEAVKQALGSDVAIRSIVDKTKVKPVNTDSAPVQDDAHASLISSVQDIMGGGEIVNV